MEWRGAPIARLAAGLRAGECTPHDLHIQARALLTTVGIDCGVLAAPTDERAIREAERATAIVVRRDASLLCGIPYGVKDVIAAAGAPTTWGSAYFANQVFTDDAAAVARLRKAGAVLVAKLATSPFAGGGSPRLPVPSMHGVTSNPWNRERWAGGSSGGPAAAVCLGAIPFAVATETAGSIVGPATYCGVTGLRTTRGAVSRHGVMGLSRTLDKVGVVARSARDCGLVFDAMRSNRAAVTAGARLAAPLAARIAARDVCIAFVADELSGCSDNTRSALTEGVMEFIRTCGQLVEIDISNALPYAEALNRIMISEAGRFFEPYLGDPAFAARHPVQTVAFERGLSVAEKDVAAAFAVRRSAAREFKRVFENADVILTVSRPNTAPALRASSSQPLGASSDNVRAAANLVGLPGVSIPCGFAQDGLPVGLHVVGRRNSESVLIELAARYQSVTDHHLELPPL